jgi:hypothetical protein
MKLDSLKSGFSQIATILTMTSLGALSVVAFQSSQVTNDNIATSTPAETPIVLSTEIPEESPAPTSILSPSPVPTTSDESTSYTHVYTNTNGVVHDVTVNGGESYNLDEGGTSIHINNN